MLFALTNAFLYTLYFTVFAAAAPQNNKRDDFATTKSPLTHWITLEKMVRGTGIEPVTPTMSR